jgi:hypothetical protein
MAPAPTDVSVTSMPITSPRITVNNLTDLWSNLLIRSAYLARTLLVHSKNVDVRSRTLANVRVTSWGNSVPFASKVANTVRVAAVAGTLPVARRLTRRQSIVLPAPWTSVPTVFVDAANRRSVPTAVAGWIPNNNMSRGVIKDPPPIPVIPTKAPMQNPEKTNMGSM